MDRGVIVGFSGGIDSTTAVRMLRDNGYRVIALTIDTIGDDEMLAKARSVAHDVGIEWIGVDARELFNREIIEYFCTEYASGRTPAPCTRCNIHVKWRILLEYADRLGMEHIATGHYFNVEEHGGKYYVARALDAAKDQSYYLWGLSQEVLRRALTPMGNEIKSAIKERFEDKRESMGICFLRGKHYTDFLSSRGVAMSAGEIVDSGGVVCGHHNGIVRYTAGQRRGEGIPEGLRVVEIDVKRNRVVVDRRENLYKHTLYVDGCNIVDIDELMSSDDITVMIRGIGINPAEPVTITPYNNGYRVSLKDGAWAPAPGQPLVFYRKNLVIGGGIVVGFE